MDPAKMKVVELRAALTERNLDAKGYKPVLVKRLKEALEAEMETKLPDTSIADTSTEDFEEAAAPQQSQEEAVAAVIETEPEPTPAAQEIPVEVEETPTVEPGIDADDPVIASPQESEDVKPAETEEQITDTPVETDKSVADEAMAGDTPSEAASEPVKEAKDSDIADEEKSNVEQNGESTNGDTEEDASGPKAKKSRWASESEVVDTQEAAALLLAPDSEPQVCQPEQRGEKRKHSTPSPERNQRRSKSPIREDEPVVDSNVVQLSWYDSDLHLQIDKTNFLSAKPLSEGLFGYIWSGARFTYGVRASKACYEVKIAEELKFDDILSCRDRERRERKESTSKKDDRERSRTKSETGSEKSMQSAQDKINVKCENAESVPEVKAEAEMKEEVVEEVAADEQKDVLADDALANAQDANKPDELDKADDTKSPSNDDKTVAMEEEDGGGSEGQEATVCNDTTENKNTDAKTSERSILPSNLLRVGWSVANSSLQLGEDRLSFALESSGRFISNKSASEGNADATFKVGDVIRAFLDLDKLQLAFAVNGNLVFEHQITLADDDSIKADELVLFPHILTRNYAFEVNAGEQDEPFSSCPSEYECYQFVSKVDEAAKVQGVLSPAKREDCEVIMMWGLPGAGKTYWVKQHVENTSDKKYNIIGNSHLLERMTVDCESIRHIVSQDRLNFFWDKLGKSVNRLNEIAVLRRRDFILDQTNLFPTAIRRKMRSFSGFKRRAIVVINDDEEQEKRQKQQDAERCKEVTQSSLMDMKVGMGLPKVGELFEEVIFSSLPEDKAHEQVQKYNKQGRDGGFNQAHRRDYREDRNNRWNRSGGGGGGPRREYQYRNNYRNRPYQNNRYDRNYRQTGNSNWRPSGGPNNAWGARNDRRDNRGPRDWRNNNRSGGLADRPQHRAPGGPGGNRDHRNQMSGNGNSYNRNRNTAGNSSGRTWGGQNCWNNTSGNWGGSPAQDSYTSGWNQSQGSWNQNHWKYGGGYNQGGYSQYPQNWNYYGNSNYSQDWGSNANSGQGQGQSGAQSTSSSTNTGDSHTSTQYGQQMTSQQQQLAWQYTQYPAQNNAASHGNGQK